MQNLDNDNNICICLGPTFIEHFSFPWKIEGPDSILTIQIRYKFIWPATAEYQYKKTIWKVTPTPSKLFLSQPKRKNPAKLCGLLHIWGQWTRGNFERVRKTIANSFLVKPLELPSHLLPKNYYTMKKTTSKHDQKAEGCLCGVVEKQWIEKVWINLNSQYWLLVNNRK